MVKPKLNIAKLNKLHGTFRFYLDLLVLGFARTRLETMREKLLLAVVKKVAIGRLVLSIVSPLHK